MYCWGDVVSTVVVNFVGVRACPGRRRTAGTNLGCGVTDMRRLEHAHAEHCATQGFDLFCAPPPHRVLFSQKRTGAACPPPRLRWRCDRARHQSLALHMGAARWRSNADGAATTAPSPAASSFVIVTTRSFGRWRATGIDARWMIRSRWVSLHNVNELLWDSQPDHGFGEGREYS